MGLTRTAGAGMLALGLVATACTGDDGGDRESEAENSTSTRTTSQGSAAAEAARSGTVKVVAAGDIAASPTDGRGTARLVRRARPDFVLTLGDNAYHSGTLAQFRRNYDPTWGRFKGKTRPVPGNHEYRTKGAAGYFRYFRNQVGGRAYYAWNAGAWRMYALNCEIRCGKGSKQLAWLKRDLARHRSRPALAYLHQPRYTCSKHSPYRGFRPMWAALQNRKGRIVLAGHNHVYERFAKQNADGRKRAGGMRQFVVGTGGKEKYGVGPASCRHRQRAVGKRDGILILRLRTDSYSWVFRTADGRVRDKGSGRA